MCQGRLGDPGICEACKRERGAYLAMEADLLRLYKGQFVAIYRGAVVAVGWIKADVIAEVRRTQGPVRAYIQKVEEEERQVRLPTSRRLIQNYDKGVRSK